MGFEAEEMSRRVVAVDRRLVTDLEPAEKALQYFENVGCTISFLRPLCARPKSRVQPTQFPICGKTHLSLVFRSRAYARNAGAERIENL
jgi:hypothetical protein